MGRPLHKGELRTIFIYCAVICWAAVFDKLEHDLNILLQSFAAIYYSRYCGYFKSFILSSELVVLYLPLHWVRLSVCFLDFNILLLWFTDILFPVLWLFLNLLAYQSSDLLFDSYYYTGSDWVFNSLILIFHHSVLRVLRKPLPSALPRKHLPCLCLRKGLL